MKRKFFHLLCACLGIGVLFPIYAHALSGDADGNGILDLDDSRTIARYLVDQIPEIPNAAEADATQDGLIDMADAFAVAQKVSGQSRIVVVAPHYGHSGELLVGDIVRIEVFERFFPLNITGGTVRIKSANTGYDSGDQSLAFENTGRSLYYHWNTAGLEASVNYEIFVALTNPVGAEVTMKNPGDPSGDATVTLSNKVFEQPFLASSVDAYCPAPGIPLEFRRVVPNDHAHYPYSGPLGMGWAHNYDMHLTEFTDGRIVYHGPGGFNRFFESNADGTYKSSPGDYGTLTRDPDGTFQLKENNGFIYRFRSDLRFDYMQDLNGNRIAAIYDGSDHLIEIRHSCGKSFFLLYNAENRISQLTDHAGRVTAYEYTNALNIPDVAGVEKTLLWKGTNPDGKVTEYAYSPVAYSADSQSYILSSRLVAIIYPDGTETRYEYDNRARLSRQTAKDGANPINFSYDADGTTRIIDAAGAETTVKVNDLGQIVSLTRPEARSPPTPSRMLYDTGANLSSVTDPLSHVVQMTYDGVGNMESFTDPLGKTYRYAYDLRFNKVSQVTTPLNKSTSFAYDDAGNLANITYPDPAASQLVFAYDAQGNMVSSQDFALKKTEFAYNSLGKVINIKNALNNNTQFAYYPDGNLQSVTDAESRSITYGRDVLGRLTQRTYPDGSHEDYGYDDSGKATSLTNRRGEQITISYDVAGRPEWKNYASGKKLHTSYDAIGLLSRVEKVEGATVTLDTAYEYDLSSRLTLAQVPRQPTGTYDVSYAYDLADNMKSVIYPDGYVLNYEYDAADRLIRIADSGDSTVAAYNYDDAGRRIRKTLGNGTYTMYSYDDPDRLTQLVNHAKDGSIQSQFAYTYNTGGFIDTMTTLEGTHTYKYDDTYQLTSVTYPDGRTVGYTFDKVGNRQTVTDDGTVTNYTTNQLNQYTKIGSETITYDDNGNMLTRTVGTDVTAYTWDEDDKLVAVERDGMHIDYRYDHQGRLVGKNSGSGWRIFIWDGLDLIAETDSNGNIIKRYVYGSRIDEVMLATDAGINHWIQQDGLGSTIGITEESGSVVSTTAYEVYGDVCIGNLGTVPQRLAGMIWDEDTEIYFVKARWYDSRIGRFLSVDPYRTKPGISPYHYAFNSPINYSDPLGLRSKALELELIRHRVIKYLHDKFEEHGIWGPKGKNPVNAFAFFDDHIKCSDMENDLLKEIGTNWNHWRIKKGWWENSTDYTHFFIVIQSVDDGNHLVIDPWTLVDPFTLKGEPIREWRDGDYYTNYFEGGSQCPTFIQPPQKTNPALPGPGEHNFCKQKLSGEIMVPINDALLRSDIPIFGVACGEKFKSYKVEYGKGYAPTEWHLIKESTKPESSNSISIVEMNMMQGDLDIRGNLATWNSGLKNWVHLPWHPPEDPTDFNGVYTIRLLVEGTEGEKVEDRVTCEVGRVIAQCQPGIAVSSDKRVTMRFPEQSLAAAFRVYTIIPFKELLDDPPSVDSTHKSIGPVYRIREPGDRFAKDVLLEFKAASEELAGNEPGHVGIARYDVSNETWEFLPTSHRPDEDSFVFTATLVELPTPEAIYTLIADFQHDGRSTPPKIDDPDKKIARRESSGTNPQDIFVYDTFETGTGEWASRDRFVGGRLSIDKAGGPDGSGALKIANESFGGSFSVTVLKQPFDAKALPQISFDYRVEPGVKTDFYLRINGRWYNLGFTDDPVDFRHKDVNIANLGRIQNIRADGEWHSASIDIYQLIREKTRHTVVEEIMMADWNVGGYMKLEFGQNARGAAYFIDNFKINGTQDKDKTSEALWIDDFNDSDGLNFLGEEFGTYNPPWKPSFTAIFLDEPVLKIDKKEAEGNPNRALVLNYDVSQPNSYGGYWTSIRTADLSQYSTLAFRMHTNDVVPDLCVGLKGIDERKGEVKIGEYVSDSSDGFWRDVKVPLNALRSGANLHSPGSLYFFASFENGDGSATVWVDDLRFEGSKPEALPTALVTDFESPINWSVHQNGAAAISVAVMPDTTAGNEKNNMVCRISYGGTVGRDFGVNGGFSYANWTGPLGGIDARPYEYLALKIRGEKGGETPDFYISDPNKRVCIRSKELLPVTSEWMDLRIPLSFFAENGIDLSYLDSFDVSFQWKEQSGTIYIDDIRFERKTVH